MRCDPDKVRTGHLIDSHNAILICSKPYKEVGISMMSFNIRVALVLAGAMLLHGQIEAWAA